MSSIDSQSYDAFQKTVLSAVVGPTKRAFSLPSGSDIQFYRSIDAEFAQDIDECSARVLEMADRLLGYVDKTKGKGKGKLESVEDVVDGFRRSVAGRLESTLEKTDMCIDEHLGQSSKPAVIAVNPKASTSSEKVSSTLHPDIFHASTLPKPQLKFRTPPDNSAQTPWMPLLTSKPHAQTPLDRNSTTHPYSYEIKNISYPPHLFTHAEPIKYASFEETPFAWIDSEEGLKDLMLDLTKEEVTEIAVDLEHHDYRTFAGFLCLMQISTRTKDYVVDTLSLREELQVLNEVFANPDVVKVFHGAESDIVWLQQNFGLYIVNLFDTYHASCILGFPKHSLASLLSTYCDFTADKKYQLADWRIRPLPQEMLAYARSDTHFLLYIFDNLRNALLSHPSNTPIPASHFFPQSLPPQDSNYMQVVLQRSSDTCLRTYVKEVYDRDEGSGKNGWANLLAKWNGGAALNNLQLGVYKAVHEWRDQVGKTDDESTRYVLPNASVFNLARTPPADMASLKNTLKKQSPCVRTRLPELLQFIRNAVTMELEKSEPVNEWPQVTDAQVSLADVVMGQEKGNVDLWGNDRMTALRSSHSMLFNDSRHPLLVPDETLPLHYSTDKSSLLPVNGEVKVSLNRREEFHKIVEKIHDAIRSAPTVEQLNSSRDRVTITTPQDQEQDVGVASDPPLETQPSKPLELEFVPLSQRQPDPSSLDVEDDIVMVGKTGSQKRKRQPNAGLTMISNPSKRARKQIALAHARETHAAMGSPSSATQGEVVDAGEDHFDYATVPNILDNVPGANMVGKQKKKLRARKAAVDYGNFPAPPKNQSEVRNGNVSKTFK